jgi:hypothetical protein
MQIKIGHVFTFSIFDHLTLNKPEYEKPTRPLLPDSYAFPEFMQ